MAQNAPVPDDGTVDIETVMAKLQRAHRMSCSEPTDPTRHTMHGDSAIVIQRLVARIAELESGT